jgi:hypothetical protein
VTDDLDTPAVGGDPDARASGEPARAAAAAGEAHEDDAPISRNLRAKRIWTVVGSVAVFALLVGLALPIFSTLQPAYYERYAQLRPRIQSWRKSTHSTVPCASCHIEPGPLGFVSFAAKAIPDFYSQLIEGPKSTNLLTVPTTAACRKCHTNYREVSPNGDLKIPHRAHVAILNIGCPFCHRNLVHSVNAKGFNTPSMTTCLVCHNGKRAENACTTCHTRKEVPANHKQKDWLAIHPTMTKTMDCASCHAWAPDYCAQCHRSRRPPSHVGNWKTAHAGPARANRKMCLVCHSQKFCDDCH